jgi:hypothetical protein
MVNPLSEGPPATKRGSRESGGGSLPSGEPAETLGVVRHMTETYSVGGFRYTSLTDAVAQARRMAKLEPELI